MVIKINKSNLDLTSYIEIFANGDWRNWVYTRSDNTLLTAYLDKLQVQDVLLDSIDDGIYHKPGNDNLVLTARVVSSKYGLITSYHHGWYFRLVNPIVLSNIVFNYLCIVWDTSW